MRSSGPLEDRLAIRELVESYNDAVMRFDADVWGSNWIEDARWSVPGLGDVSGRDAIVATWQQAMAMFDCVGFFASAGPLVVNGDEAHGTWYQQEFLYPKDGAKRVVIGRYDDEYVKRSGRWYFRNRAYAILKAE
jgi:ketosteroid isomerase-like protein